MSIWTRLRALWWAPEKLDRLDSLVWELNVWRIAIKDRVKALDGALAQNAKALNRLAKALQEKAEDAAKAEDDGR